MFSDVLQCLDLVQNDVCFVINRCVCGSTTWWHVAGSWTGVTNRLMRPAASVLLLLVVGCWLHLGMGSVSF